MSPDNDLPLSFPLFLIYKSLIALTEPRSKVVVLLDQALDCRCNKNWEKRFREGQVFLVEGLRVQYNLLGK